MINIDEDNLKNGVLGLVLAVVEILRDALQNQATRRIESGALTGEEVERLGAALADLDAAIEGIKLEQGLDQHYSRRSPASLGMADCYFVSSMEMI